MKQIFKTAEVWFLISAAIFLFIFVIAFIMGDRIGAVINLIASILFFIGYIYHISQRKRKKKIEDIKINYNIVFIFGFIWILIGVFMRDSGIWGLGFLFFIIGLTGKLMGKEK